MTAVRQLILVRHASPRPDPTRPASRWVLSDEGRARSQALARSLAAHRPAAIVSSEEPKARETARIVAAHLGLEAHALPDLGEHARESVPFFDDVAEFEAAVERALASPDERVFGEETANQALARFDRAVARALRRHAGTLAIIAHGTVIALFVASRTGGDARELWRGLGLAEGVAIEMADDGVRLRGRVTPS